MSAVVAAAQRPAQPLWDTIVGQAGAVRLLQRALATDRLAHAYAFVGPSGVGRRLTALAFAQAVLCPTGGCGDCPACRRVAALQHPDLRVLVPTPPKDNPRGAPALRIEDVRTLEHWAALAPHEGRLKVFVLDDADRMTLPTAQALLKTLEEPPARTLLILILANPRGLPPTVLSRCQRVRFRSLGEPELAACLQARGVDPGDSRRLARLCQGQLGVALATDLATLSARRAAALDLLRTPIAHLAGRLDAARLDRDRAAVAGCLEVYWVWFRDALWLQAGGDPAGLVNADLETELAAFAAEAPAATLVAAIGRIKDAWLALEGNVTPRLALEHALVGLGRTA